MSVLHNVFQGKIHNGVVVLDGGATLPEGTLVEVVVNAPPPNKEEKMTEEEHRRLMEVMDRIASMPDENPGDTFSGADHDKVLYREP
jgi:hypothetical protein